MLNKLKDVDALYFLRDYQRNVFTHLSTKKHVNFGNHYGHESASAL